MSSSQGIFCVGVDHHSTSLGVREALASFAGDRWIQHLIEHEGYLYLAHSGGKQSVEIQRVRLADLDSLRMPARP